MLQLTDKDARVATMKWAKIQGREHREHRKMSMKGEEKTLRDEGCVQRKDNRIHMAWSQKGEQFMRRRMIWKTGMEMGVHEGKRVTKNVI